MFGLCSGTAVDLNTAEQLGWQQLPVHSLHNNIDPESIGSQQSTHLVRVSGRLLWLLRFSRLSKVPCHHCACCPIAVRAASGVHDDELFKAMRFYATQHIDMNDKDEVAK